MPIGSRRVTLQWSFKNTLEQKLFVECWNVQAVQVQNHYGKNIREYIYTQVFTTYTTAETRGYTVQSVNSKEFQLVPPKSSL